MSLWRRKAIEALPELAREIGDAATPMSAWIEIEIAFMSGYASEPINEDLIRRVYAYAYWCLDHGSRATNAEYDLPTCVAVCFLETLPSRPEIRKDMQRWFTLEEVRGMKDIFTYNATDEEYAELLSLYGVPARQAKRAGRSSKS